MVHRGLTMPAFGYVPSRSLCRDLVGRFVGWPNLFKRLQAKDIMGALDLSLDDLALDVGCGSGAFTFEMGRRCQRATGIDVKESILRIPIPVDLAGRVEFQKGRGESLPFPNDSFDVVLLSEVLPMTDDPEQIIREATRVIRPGGRVIIVNGLGHPWVARAYAKRGLFVQMLSALGRIEQFYDEFVANLMKEFGTAIQRFYCEAELVQMVEKQGFQVCLREYSPKRGASRLNSIVMVLARAAGLPAYGRFYFALYPILWLAEQLDATPGETGLILVAAKPDQ